MRNRILLTPAGQWVLRHKALLSGAFLAFALLFSWQGVQLADSKEKPVEDLFTAWKNDPSDGALYRDLQTLAKKIPGPHPIHAQIAQVLLFLNRSDEAEPTFRVSLERLRMTAPVYAEFAEISLLVSRKNYQEALERSVSLKEALEEKSSVLYGKNLVRIAFLQQQLENRAGEMAAWNELEETMAQGLVSRESDFQAYLDERRKVMQVY